MRTVHIFFGEMGAGKSFVGARFAQEHNFPFFEGDDAVPPQMAKVINLLTPPPEKIVASFIENELLQSIIYFAGCHPLDSDLVVSQALYREHHRNTLAWALLRAGFDPKFYWVRCGLWQHTKQLLSRPKGLGWLWFRLINSVFFQRPLHPHTVVLNSK